MSEKSKERAPPIAGIRARIRVQRAQLGRGRIVHARLLQQRIDPVERLDAARDARQGADGAAHRLGQVGRGRMRVQVHEVVGVHVCQRPLGELGIADASNRARNGRTLPHTIRHPGTLSFASAPATRRTASASPFCALTPINSKPSCVNWRVAPASRAAARTDGRLMAQAQRKSTAAMRAHDANDGQGVVGADDRKAAVVIEEAKRRVGRARPPA